MSNRKNFLVNKVCFFYICFIIITTNCFSYIHANGSTSGYNEETQSPGIQGNISLEMLVIEGAGYFLKANAKVQSLLNQVELRDIKSIDYIELNQLVKCALINIINSRLAYDELIKVAEATPYNVAVIEQLNQFDYENFMKEYGLNHFIFGIIRDYLIKGDITGTYKYSYINFKTIEQLLMTIQSSITENRIPELNIFWRLNELCAEESLFGSYVARIFKEIK